MESIAKSIAHGRLRIYNYVYTSDEVKFTWDERKERLNIASHGFSFATAQLVFDDPNLVVEQDREVDEEPRWQAIGMVNGIHVLLVAYVDFELEETIHIISARKATPRERRKYAKNS